MASEEIATRMEELIKDEDVATKSSQRTKPKKTGASPTKRSRTWAKMNEQDISMLIFHKYHV
jgi:hypothetical protein